MGISVGSVPASDRVSGNGQVFHRDGLLYALPPYGVWPLQYLHPDGDGPPIIRLNNQGSILLSSLIGADGAITTDQPFAVPAAQEYIIDQVVVCHATATPGAMAGGIYTDISKGGEAVIAAAETYAGLTGDPYNVLLLTPTAALRAAPWLFLSLTTANGAPITFDLYLYGRVVRPIEG